MVGKFGVERDCNRLVAVLNGRPVGTCRDHLLSSFIVPTALSASPFHRG